jgi:hypothetical protein
MPALPRSRLTILVAAAALAGAELAPAVEDVGGR